ncbi:MAG: acylneuraminate cytidylyltransferase family protein [bacterium]
MKKEKVLCVIPARGGSKRLPGKNIMKVGGVPLIARSVEAALRAKLVGRVVVSTDDEAIAAAAREAGAEVMERPAEISGDTAAIEESLRHVVRTLKETHSAEKENLDFDIVVLLQANIVYRAPGVIDSVIRKLADNPKFTAVITVIEVTQRPEWMKRVEDGRLAPYMKCEKFRQQELEKLYVADGSVIAVRTSTLMETAGRTGVHVYMGGSIGYVVQEDIFATEIDRPDDVARAEVVVEMLEKRRGGGG